MLTISRLAPTSAVDAKRYLRPAFYRHRLSLKDSFIRSAVTGILRRGALVMYGRSTYSLWPQEGEAIAGPPTGTRLRRLESGRTTWGAWLRRHLDTLVLLPLR